MNIPKNKFFVRALIGLLVLLVAIAGIRIWDSQHGKRDVTVDDTTQLDWQVVDAGPFTISLPQGWALQPQQGIDSYVADFVGDGMRLSFDFGWYSSPLAEEDDARHRISYETIDGQRAKIVIPKIIGEGLTGVYFEGLGNNGMNRLQISGENLRAEQQELALRIFRTIVFTDPSRSLLPE